jgi:two-component system nitrate/nitrite response regulator NarL
MEILTPREREIVDELCQGKCNKLIARALNISEGTVKVHLVNIVAKLGLQGRGRVAIVALIHKMGMS